MYLAIWLPGSAEHEGARQVTAAREVEQCSRYVAAAVKRVRADHAVIPARAFPLFVPRACLRSPSTMQHRLDLAVRSLLVEGTAGSDSPALEGAD